MLSLCCLFAAVSARAVTLVDIYGPGQNMVNLALATPLTGPGQAATGLGKELGAAVESNLAFLPFMRLTPSSAVLGGTVLEAWQGAKLDFRRFQIAGADMLLTAYWPAGDGRNGEVEVRLFETFSGKPVFGGAYKGVTSSNVPEMVRQQVCWLLRMISRRLRTRLI